MPFPMSQYQPQQRSTAPVYPRNPNADGIRPNPIGGFGHLPMTPGMQPGNIPTHGPEVTTGNWGEAPYRRPLPRRVPIAGQPPFSQPQFPPPVRMPNLAGPQQPNIDIDPGFTPKVKPVPLSPQQQQSQNEYNQMLQRMRDFAEQHKSELQQIATPTASGSVSPAIMEQIHSRMSGLPAFQQPQQSTPGWKTADIVHGRDPVGSVQNMPYIPGTPGQMQLFNASNPFGGHLTPDGFGGYQAPALGAGRPDVATPNSQPTPQPPRPAAPMFQPPPAPSQPQQSYGSVPDAPQQHSQWQPLNSPVLNGEQPRPIQSFDGAYNPNGSQVHGPLQPRLPANGAMSEQDAQAYVDRTLGANQKYKQAQWQAQLDNSRFSGGSNAYGAGGQDPRANAGDFTPPEARYPQNGFAENWKKKAMGLPKYQPPVVTDNGTAAEKAAAWMTYNDPKNGINMANGRTDPKYHAQQEALRGVQAANATRDFETQKTALSRAAELRALRPKTVDLGSQWNQTMFRQDHPELFTKGINPDVLRYNAAINAGQGMAPGITPQIQMQLQALQQNQANNAMQGKLGQQALDLQAVQTGAMSLGQYRQKHGGAPATGGIDTSSREAIDAVGKKGAAGHMDTIQTMISKGIAPTQENLLANGIAPEDVKSLRDSTAPGILNSITGGGDPKVHSYLSQALGEQPKTMADQATSLGNWGMGLAGLAGLLYGARNGRGIYNRNFSGRNPPGMQGPPPPPAGPGIPHNFPPPPAGPAMNPPGIQGPPRPPVLPGAQPGPNGTPHNFPAPPAGPPVTPPGTYGPGLPPSQVIPNNAPGIQFGPGVKKGVYGPNQLPDIPPVMQPDVPKNAPGIQFGKGGNPKGLQGPPTPPSNMPPEVPHNFPTPKPGRFQKPKGGPFGPNRPVPNGQLFGGYAPGPGSLGEMKDAFSPWLYSWMLPPNLRSGQQ